jgi:hypothetical protein
MHQCMDMDMDMHVNMHMYMLSVGLTCAGCQQQEIRGLR